MVHALYCNAAPWRLMGVMACHSTHAGKLTELWGLQLPAGGVSAHPLQDSAEAAVTCRLQ